MPGMPYGSARRARSSIGVVLRSGLYSPYRLFVMMNTTGVFQTAAMFSASWNVPMFVAPSPKNVRATFGFFCSLNESAAPTAIGSPAPTMAFAPMLPLLTSMRCIEPADPARAAGRATHELREGGLGRHAQGERLAVAAIRVGLDVARLHRRDRADRDRLLALAEVGRALDQPGHEQLLDLLLEQADPDHRPVPVESVGSRRGGHVVVRLRGCPRAAEPRHQERSKPGGTVSSFDYTSWHPGRRNRQPDGCPRRSWTVAHRPCATVPETVTGTVPNPWQRATPTGPVGDGRGRG